MKKVNIYVNGLGEDFLNKPTEEFEKELPISDPVPVEKKEITQSALNKRLSRIQNSIKTTTDKANEIIEISNEVQNKIIELVGGSNIIYYKATNKLPEVTEGEGLHIDAFNVQITSHDFENGEGIIIFDGDVTEIGNYAFGGCTDLIDITIPDKVESIGDYAFEHCTSLTSIVFPESVTHIGDYAFSNCSALTEIDIPNNISSYDISSFAFSGCDNIEKISVGKKFVETEGQDAGGSLFDNWDGIELIIKPGATFIADYCFEPYNDAAHFNNVIIPDTVTKIGDYAFYNTHIKNIEIPNSITEIGAGAFADCDFEEFIIPDGVTNIEHFVFANCPELTSINIPDGVISIGNEAFRECSSLTSITIPNSVTIIGDDAFYGCTGLTSINIPGSVTNIGDFAFSGCPLTSITIPDSVTNIGDFTFSNSELTSITSLATTAPTIQDNTFKNVNDNGTLTVPSGSTGYDVWMGTGDYYLGKYNWTIVEQ